MSAGLRIIDTGVMPSRWNVAVTAALIELHRAEPLVDTIRFHRYPRSVLVGRHQDLEAEVDVERCRKDGVEIARRVTGGGTVYMSPSILAWDIVAERYRLGPGLTEVSLRIGSAVAAGLRRLGLAAKYNAPGDIEIDGRKICGSCGCFEGPTMVMQGTILIEFDRDEMAGLLKPRPGAPKPVSRVTSLSSCLGRVPPIEEVQAGLLAELTDACPASITIEDLGAHELTLAEKLLAGELGSDEFAMGQTMDAAARTPKLPRWSKRAS
jgi:lipoate---protein ligase